MPAQVTTTFIFTGQVNVTKQVCLQVRGQHPQAFANHQGVITSEADIIPGHNRNAAAGLHSGTVIANTCASHHQSSPSSVGLSGHPFFNPVHVSLCPTLLCPSLRQLYCSPDNSTAVSIRPPMPILSNTNQSRCCKTKQLVCGGAGQALSLPVFQHASVHPWCNPTGLH